MPRVVYLDTGPLGLACYFPASPTKEAARFQQWLSAALANRIRIIIPAIADYELRRELIRSGSTNSVANLDRIESGQDPSFPGVVYLPMTDVALRRAASLWATARNQGFATAHDKALDGDVLIAAQVLEHAAAANRFFIATANVGDIARYVGRRARPWETIMP